MTPTPTDPDPVATTTSEPYKYWAFISYSSQDRRWAQWLIRALEGYRIPRGLRGRQTRYGSVPPRLVPVFRDRDELRAAPDLHQALEHALRQSRHLIVICSPSAAEPNSWVNEEIVTFKKMGRSDDILALIVDGEPDAADGPGSETAECFPEALRHEVDADGHVTPRRTEPLAADVRREADGPRVSRRRALLKLVAQMVDVDFDTLWGRERQRRRRRIVGWTGVTALLISVIGGLSVLGTRATRSGVSVQLADRAAASLEQNVDDALLLSVAAYRTAPTPQAYGSLLSTVEATSHLLTGFHSPGARVQDVAVGPDGRQLAVATCAEASCEESRVSLYDLGTGQALRSPIDIQDGPVTRLLFQPGTGRLDLIVATDDGYVFGVLDPASSRPELTSLYRDTRRISLAEWSPGGAFYVVAVDDDRSTEYKLFPRGGGRRCGDLRGGKFVTAAFDENATLLALGNEDGDVLVVSTTTCETREAHGMRIADLAFDSFQPGLLSIMPDGTVREWSLGTELEAESVFSLNAFMWDGFIHEFDGRGGRVASKDGRDVLVTDIATRLRLLKELRTTDDAVQRSELELEMERLQPIRLAGHSGEPVILRYGGDGRFLASADDQGTVLVWELDAPPLVEPDTIGTDAPTRTPGSDGGESRVSATSPDGRIRATAEEAAQGCSGDSTMLCRRTTRLILTDPGTGEAVHTLETVRSGWIETVGSNVMTMSFEEDGDVTTTGFDYDRPVARYTWHIAPGSLISLACRRANRRLTRDDEVLRQGFRFWQRWLAAEACT